MTEAEAEKAVKGMMRDALAWIYRGLVLAALGGLAWQGRNMADAFIAQSPKMVAVESDLADAKSSASVAKDVANKAADKADQIIAAQSRLFDALKQEHVDQQATNVSIATLVDHVAGLEKQLDRVEAKQDKALQ